MERSLLVNEPAVTCPQDQVQKPKSLNKDRKRSDYCLLDKRIVVNTFNWNIAYSEVKIQTITAVHVAFPFLLLFPEIDL